MNKIHKNILIVFDAGGCHPLSMHSFIELAAGLQAGIQALYVEDINLLTAVELPFTSEISLQTAQRSSIDSKLMIQKLRADAENIKKQIEEMALSRKVSISFSSMRGQKTQLIKNRTEELDIVLIPAAYSASARKQQLQTNHIIAMIYDTQNPSCENALNIALSRAANNNYQLFIVVDSLQSKQHVEHQLAQHGVHGTSQLADFSKLDEILLLLQQHSPELLVLTETSRLINDEQVFARLINSLECDILLAR